VKFLSKDAIIQSMDYEFTWKVMIRIMKVF